MYRPDAPLPCAQQGIAHVRGFAGWQSLRQAAVALNSPPDASGHWPWGMSHTRVPDLDTARRLFDPGGDAARQARQAVFFANPGMRARARLRIGMHDRGESYMVANGQVQPEDLAGHARHFPFRLQCVRLKSLSVGAGECLDVGADITHWPQTHERDELYTLLFADDLWLEPGAQLVLNGTVAFLRFGHVHVAPGEGGARIDVRGTQHAGFSAHRRQTHLDGACGTHGADGAAAVAPVFVATPFGPQAVQTQPAQAPGRGEAGGAGQPGGPGPNGGLQMLADVRIMHRLHGAPGALQILGQATCGHDAGNGGDGGNGGAGGRNNASGFPDAPAGHGGDGGDGGRGGNGGLGSNIFVSLPRADLPVLRPVSLPSIGGQGGLGGLGGRGLSVGQSGRNGPNGRNRDGPPIWVFAEGENDPTPLLHQFTSAT